MEFLEVQTNLVKAVVASADAGAWERLLCNLEILEHADDYQIDYVCLAVVKNGGELAMQQFHLSDAARKAATDLYRQRKGAGETIGGFELAIDADGRFKLTLDHGAPKRINGEWDEAREGRLDNYLEHYKAELAAR